MLRKRGGEGGVGSSTSLNLHTCLMLRKRRCGGGVRINMVAKWLKPTQLFRKSLHQNNRLPGQTLHGAHIAGLTAIHIHRHLGLENVLQCFTKYIHHVRDQTWLNTVD